MVTLTRIALGLLALGAVALASVGCGGGTTTNVVTRTVTETTPAEATTRATTTTEATESPTTQSHAPATAGPSEPPAHFVRLPSFDSPSRNIGCMLIGGLARCDIVKRNWVPPPRPKACPHIVDYGQGLEVGRSGTAEFVCAGDTARDPTAEVLPYGTASQVGPFVCVSRTSGMTCTNRMNGHGFFISIQSYRRF
jgi:hypothetical protein